MTPPGFQVTFKPEYQAGASGRNFGWVKLDGESLAAAVAKEGWARVKEQGTSSQSSELEELVSPAVVLSGFRECFVCFVTIWRSYRRSDTRAMRRLVEAR